METHAAMILCCQCGTPIESNPSNMCVACLRSEVDISAAIPKQGVLHFCRACERYLQPPNIWVVAALESRELLALCLKKLKGLSTVRLVDAGFVWTEPHSKRIKVKLTIQKEVMNGAVLQQVFIVEYVVQNQMCDDCHRVEAKNYWRAAVQIRQKTTHKKTLFYLEQLILKYKAHVNTTSIKQVHEGLDFYYERKQDAKKLVDFLQAYVPCRYKTAQELISHDIHSNTFNAKNVFAVEIVPIIKDNVVCLPPKLAQQLGNLGQICIVSRVTQAIHLIDPNTCQIAEVSGTNYWRYPFEAIGQPKQLVEFIVIQVEILDEKSKRHVAGRGIESQKHVLASAWVMKASELGGGGREYHCRTHLGHLLHPGDSVLGLDIAGANMNNTYLDNMSSDVVPDVVLVKKVFGDNKLRQKKRKWKLKHLAVGDGGTDSESVERDYDDFLNDLEEDPALRQNVNVYREASKMAVDTDETDDDEGIPRITLAEMLDDMNLDTGPDQDTQGAGRGNEEEAMME